MKVLTELCNDIEEEASLVSLVHSYAPNGGETVLPLMNSLERESEGVSKCVCVHNGSALANSPLAHREGYNAKFEYSENKEKSTVNYT